MIRNTVVEAMALSLVHLSALERLNLADIDMYGSDIIALADVLPQVASLRILILERNRIVKDSCACLARAVSNMPDTRCLNLGGCGQDNEIRALAPVLEKMGSLQQLHLQCSHINIIGVYVLRTVLSNLQDLQLLNLCEIGRGARVSALHLQLPRSLKHLNLRATAANAVDVKSFAYHLTELTALEHLNLYGGALENEGVRALAPVLSCHTLIKSLNLSHADLMDDGMTVLAMHLTSLEDMQELCLMGNRVGNLAAEALAACFWHITALKQLDMKSTFVEAAQIRVLAAGISALTALQDLSLSSNPVEADGMHALAPSLSHLTALTALNLKDCQIKDDGAIELSAAFCSFSCLQSLILGGDNCLTHEGIAALAAKFAHFGNLRKLDLSQSKIGKQGARSLASSFIHLTCLEDLSIECNIGDEGFQSHHLMPCQLV